MPGLAAVRRRAPRFERLKFRVVDGRAREALLDLLARMPVAAAAGEPSSAPAGPGQVLEGPEVGAALERMVHKQPPLEHPLSFYLLRLEGPALLLTRSEVLPQADPDALPRWEERALAAVRRIAPDAYRLRRGAGAEPVET